MGKKRECVLQGIRPSFARLFVSFDKPRIPHGEGILLNRQLNSTTEPASFAHLQSFRYLVAYLSVDFPGQKLARHLLLLERSS